MGDNLGKLKHPMQPAAIDVHGVARFKANAIVRFLLNQGPFDLNMLAAMPWNRKDYLQLQQLIGYSVNGYLDMDLTDEEYAEAVAILDALEASPEETTP